jgi:hypothetical protein
MLVFMQSTRYSCRVLKELNFWADFQNIIEYLMPCKATKKIQQHATVYQDFYFIVIWSSTCFGRHTAHHQEPKTVLAASGFTNVEGCWTCSCWTLSGRIYSTWQHPATTRPTTLHVWKPEGASAGIGSCWWAVCRPKHVELHINMI